jgi:hypothetical protein
MRAAIEGVLVNRDQYGPFDDGRTIPFVDLASPDGGGLIRLTVAEQYEGPAIADLTLLEPMVFWADLRADKRLQDLKGRLVGVSPASARTPAAKAA